MINDALASSSSSSAATTMSDSTISEKHTLDVKNSECPQAKHVKCGDSTFVSNFTVVSSLTASTKPLASADNHTEGDVTDKFVECITISDSKSNFTE